ncbi:hypothetical protein Fcan01_06326 [Folsomia candida]|uniref:Protein inscuteable homologue C-terminal domain-containing protein n=1 Tax=Folsomia candida TaxID=158441 RepID=A0A226EUA5_FOLCA|nr:hypothetical protein Fcan01_06326 [Folsomia candida]
MASASTYRSPLSVPTQIDPSQKRDTPTNFPSTSNYNSCPFRRSRSRVLYDSEYATGTSWEFRRIDSPQLYQTQMHLSVLRSPQVNINSSRLNCSPLPVMIADSSPGVHHHRSIPSPPTKDDLSDGSRNSTGSSTGSHRSQDSGFSDTGETRPSRRNLSIASSPHLLQNLSNSPSLQLQHNQFMAAVSSRGSNNSNGNIVVDSFCGVDSNLNYLSSNGTCQQHLRGRTSATFIHTHDLNHPHHLYQQHDAHQPPYSLANGNNHVYECYSNPVPSPIPHTGSGCGGKVMTIRRSGSTFTLPKEAHTPHPTDYVEINGNGVVVGENCSNCIYQEIVLSQHQSQSPPPQGVHSSYHKNGSNSSQQQQYQQLHNVHYHLSQNRSSAGNYALYSTISPASDAAEQNGHLGHPICSSTPKRGGNLSPSSNPSSRLSIMKKIDNFESLNKNQRALDNNNNSSNSNSSANVVSSSPTSAKKVKNSPKNLNHQLSSSSQVSSPAPSTPAANTSSSSTVSHYEKHHSSKGSKKHYKLSLSSLSSSNPQKSPQSNISASSQVSTSGNKTVVSRGPLPLPPTPEAHPPQTSSHENNSFTPNEVSTYASHSQLKSCIKSSPKWKNIPKGYKRVSTRDLAVSCTSDAGVQTCSSDGTIVVKSHFDNESMRLWLHELRSQTENECFYMLQTKSIISEEDNANNQKKHQQMTTVTSNASDSDSGTYGSQGSRSSGSDTKKKSVVEAIHSISAPLMSIKNVEQMANVVSAEFAKICKNIEFGFLSQVPRLVQNLVSYVEEFLRTFQGTSVFGNLQKLEHKLSRSCRRLHRSAQVMMEISGNSSEYKQPTSVHSIIESENMKKGEGYHVAVSEVVDGIVTVGNLFSQVVDLRLTRDLTCVLDTVEGGGVPAKVALKSFANILMDGGNHLCRLASEIRTVRGMLSVILDAKDDYLIILSLRCLATVLCVGEAVKDFDRASGFEIVADFMYEPMYSFDLKIEAVAVLTQATGK